MSTISKRQKATALGSIVELVDTTLQQLSTIPRFSFRFVIEKSIRKRLANLQAIQTQDI